jgi:hypothetical protein
MKRLRAFVAVGVMLAALPAVTLAAEDSSPCAADSTWIDMDDLERHPAALDREALGIYDANGDAQTCVRPMADEREGNLRVAYKASDPDESLAAGAGADCPKDSGPVDVNRPDTMPAPLTREILTHYDLNGDGQLCVSRSLLGEGDFTIDVQVVDSSTFLNWCGGRLATIVGTPQDETIHGTPDDDVIVGLDSDDDLDGFGHTHDLLDGGPGDDQLFVEGRSDTTTTMYGGADKEATWIRRQCTQTMPFGVGCSSMCQSSSLSLAPQSGAPVAMV